MSKRTLNEEGEEIIEYLYPEKRPRPEYEYVLRRGLQERIMPLRYGRNYPVVIEPFSREQRQELGEIIRRVKVSTKKGKEITEPQIEFIREEIEREEQQNPRFEEETRAIEDINLLELEVARVEVTDDIKVLLRDDNEIKLLYRAVKIYDSKLKNAAYLKKILDKGEEVSTYWSQLNYRDVINHKFNDCLDPTNINYFSSGKFHCITMIPINFLSDADQELLPATSVFVTEKDYDWNDAFNFNFNEVFFATLTTSYELITLHNSIFGMLNFNINSYYHNYLKESIAFILLMSNRLVRTGALGGYGIEQIKAYFGSFTINISSSAGGGPTLVPGTRGGLRFFKNRIGPFSIDDLLLKDEQNDFFEKYDRLNTAVAQKFITVLNYASNGSSQNDMSDILDYNEHNEEGGVGYETTFFRRYEIYQRRMDDVTIKFFPHVIEPLNLIAATTSHFQPQVIHRNEEGELQIPPIQAAGDVVYGKIDPEYHMVPLADTGGKITDKSFKNITQFMTDSTKLIEGYNDSNIAQAPFIVKNMYVGDDLEVEIKSAGRKVSEPKIIWNPGKDDLIAMNDDINIDKRYPSVMVYSDIFNADPNILIDEREGTPEVILSEGEELIQIPAKSDIEEFLDDPEYYMRLYDLVIERQTGNKPFFSYYLLIDSFEELLEPGEKYNLSLRSIFGSSDRDRLKGYLNDFSFIERIQSFLKTIQYSQDPNEQLRYSALKAILRKFKELVNSIFQMLQKEVYETYPFRGTDIYDPRFLLLTGDMSGGLKSKIYHNWIREVMKILQNYTVGCLIDKDSMIYSSLKRMPQLYSPEESLSNNCYIECILMANGMIKQEDTFNDKDAKCRKVRTDLNIFHSEHLDMDEMAKIANEYFLDVYFWEIIDISLFKPSKIILSNLNRKPSEENNYTYSVKEDKNKPEIIQEMKVYYIVNSKPIHDEIEKRRVDVLVHKHHCYLILNRDIITTKGKCSFCKQWISKKGFYTKHATTCFYCYSCRRPYSTKKNPIHQCAGKPSDFFKLRISKEHSSSGEINSQKDVQSHKIWKHMKPEKLTKKNLSLKKIWFADIETFPSLHEDSIYRPYAIGIMNGENFNEKEPMIFYGKDCMTDFLDYLDKIEGLLYFFNGSMFDNFITIRGMVENNKHISTEGFIKHGNRIIAYNYHSKLKVHDLYLFIGSSLEKACKAWGVPQEFSKKEFDHSLVYDYASAEENRILVTEYLKYDVISLAYLYYNYSTTMFKCFSKSVDKAITPSQYAVQCWSSMCGDLVKEFYIPQTGKEENDSRLAYYGGRVMCQRKAYESSDYHGPNIEYDYDTITDYIIDADVNSLYPTAQIKFKYAYGKWKYITFGENGERMDSRENDSNELDYDSYLDRINSLVDTEWMNRCCYCVDIFCPKDLITAFLLERDSKGEIHHTLFDKEKQWYWGNEIAEAILIGYRVTHIHEIKEYEKLGDIFHSYVNKCWEGRQKNPKPSLINLAYKNALVCLTGKFGQKSSITSTKIYKSNSKIDKRYEKQFYNILQKVTDFQPIYSDKGNDCAIILELENDDKDPHYPIDFSGQILANSRVYMSRIMRHCNAYFEPDRAIYYTDTDSLLLPSECLPILAKHHLIGSHLGQLSCDLHDGDLRFSKIVKAIWSATKGPYSLIYLNPGEIHLKEKVRVKGIPHTSEPFLHSKKMEITLNTKDRKEFNHILNWIEKPFLYSVPPNLVKKRFYMFKYDKEKSGDENVYFQEHINAELIELMMKHEGFLYCFYGGMRRAIGDSNGRILSVTPNIVRRTACKSDWWSRGKRMFIESDELDSGSDEKTIDNAFRLSYPPGYCIRNARVSVDYDYESLMRLAQNI